jgi:hypothetical protein
MSLLPTGLAGLGGAALSYLGSRQQENSDTAFRANLQDTYGGTPAFNLAGAFGSVTGGQDARINLAPRLESLQTGTAGGAQSGLSQLQGIPSFNQLSGPLNFQGPEAFDVDKSATDRFNILEQILAPGREKSFGQLDTNLFNRGLLTSTTGVEAQVGARQGVEQQRLQDLLSSFGEARAGYETNLKGYQAGLQGQQEARLGREGLISGAQAERGSILQQVLGLSGVSTGIDNFELQALLGSLGAGANAQASNANLAGAVSRLGSPVSSTGSLLSGAGSILSSLRL